MFSFIKTLLIATHLLGNPASDEPEPTPAADGPGCISIIYYETAPGSGVFDTHSGEHKNCSWAYLNAIDNAVRFRGENILVHDDIRCDRHNYAALMVYLRDRPLSKGVCIPTKAHKPYVREEVQKLKKELPELRTDIRCLRPGCV